MLIRLDRPRWGLTRRAALRGGLSTFIGLPLLEAMAPAQARAQTAGVPPLRRFIVFYTPNGMLMPSFTPANVGDLGALPPILAPLEGVKQHINVISGLFNAAADRGDDPAGPHARGTASFLTGAHILASETTLQNGVSCDQLVADHVRSQGFRGLASLELGCEGGGTREACDANYSCAYQVNISWRSAQAPMAKETNPRSLFDRLFSVVDNGNSVERARQRRRKQSILDAVTDDAARVSLRLSAHDRQKIEEHLTGIRELERRLDDVGADATCEFGAAPDDVDVNAVADVTGHVRSMIDLMVLACRCDRTRVMTFMLGNGGSPRDFSFIGVEGQHHGISHRSALASSLERIDIWEMEQFSYFVDQLSRVDDGDGVTALDSSFVYCGSELSDGNRHTRDNLPVVIAGRAGGAVAPTNRHVVHSPRPVSDLLLAGMQSMGMSSTSFADSTGPLPL